jgi:molecular chaperone HscB
MNYFELFQIPVQLQVDASGLGKKFFELSKKHHPDYFINGTVEEQQEALEISSLLNKAYKTFQKKDLTIKYVLQLKGLLEEEEKYQLPPDFLMEVLEINEAVMDMQLNEDADADESLITRINLLKNEIYEPVKEIIEQFDEAVHTEKELLQVKDYYFKKKYLDRIAQQLNGMM